MVITDVNQVVYQGDGATTAFPFTFRIIDATDVKLLLIDADGTETDITSDYFVDTNTNTVYYPGYAPGAEPGLADQPAPVQTGQRLVVYRELPVTQEKDLGEKWPFFVIELALDKLTMLIQGISGIWNRCLRVTVGQSATHPDFNYNIPIEAGKTFRVKDDGTGFELTEDPAVAHAAAVAAQEAAERAQGAAEDAADNAEDALGLIKEKATWLDNVAAMKAAAGLQVGMLAGTKGYYSINDGGSSIYTIRAKTQDDVEDGSKIIFLNNGNVAELINSENYLPFSYYRVTYVKADVGNSYVYYSIIPKEYQPELTIANDTIGTTEDVEQNAYENKSSLTINAGLFNLSTEPVGEPIGIVYKDGTVLHNNDVTSGGHYALYMTDDGELKSVFADNVPTEDIVALNPVWAVQGWEPIIENGVNLYPTESSSAYHPRTCIGQDYDGNYFVLVCEGRSPSSVGMTYYDVANFATVQLGLNLKFLYNLDGGGSSSFVYHGIRRNEYTDRENRPVATFITFRRKTVKSDDAFSDMNGIAKYFRHNNLLNGTPITESGTTVNFYGITTNNQYSSISFYSPDESTPPKYNSFFSIGSNSADMPFAVATKVSGTLKRILQYNADDGQLYANSSYCIPGQPMAMPLTFNENATINDNKCCKIGNFMCISFRFTLASNLARYAVLVSDMPDASAGNTYIMAFNTTTGEIFPMYHSGSDKNIKLNKAIPAGSYFVNAIIPQYKS